MGRRAAKVKEFLNRILGAKTPGKAEPSEEDRATFKVRYQTFRQLLGAGNRAQEAMAAMEEALAGDRPLGIHLVRSLATTASAEVFRMATLLEKLAPGAHRGLFDRFKELQAAVAESLAPPPPPPPGPFVLPLSGLGLAEAPAAGTKMAALGEAAGALGLAVPEGFVITAAAWRRFMEVNALQEELDRLIQVADAGSLSDFFGLSADLQRLILAAQVPDDLAEAILTACRELAAGQTGQPRFGLRSSLADPGAPPDASFAGQFRSELNASLEHVLHVYKLILASKYTVPATDLPPGAGVARRSRDHGRGRAEHGRGHARRRGLFPGPAGPPVRNRAHRRRLGADQSCVRRRPGRHLYRVPRQPGPHPLPADRRQERHVHLPAARRPAARLRAPGRPQGPRA